MRRVSVAATASAARLAMASPSAPERASQRSASSFFSRPAPAASAASTSTAAPSGGSASLETLEANAMMAAAAGSPPPPAASSSSSSFYSRGGRSSEFVFKPIVDSVRSGGGEARGGASAPERSSKRDGRLDANAFSRPSRERESDRDRDGGRSGEYRRGDEDRYRSRDRESGDRTRDAPYRRDDRPRGLRDSRDADRLPPRADRGNEEGPSPAMERAPRRRRTFQRPTFAEEDEAGVAAPTSEETALSEATSSGASSLAAKRRGPQYNPSSEEEAPSASIFPGGAHSTYEEAEAAILAKIDGHMDPAAVAAISNRVSQTARGAAARAKIAITDDDPLLKIYDTSRGDNNPTGEDEELRELRATRDEAKRDRIRLEGTTGAGLAGESATAAAAGAHISASDRIPIHEGQSMESVTAAEAAEAAGPTVTAEMLSPEQRELLWEDRKRTYGVIHRKLLIALESHASAMDKLLLLMELHDLVVRRRLLLRADIYTDIFATAFTALAGPDHYASNNRKKITMLDELWVMYTYALDSGVDPTSKMIRNVMRILSLSATTDADVEAKAHKLMLDSDKFKLIPSPTTLSAYYTVCGTNNAMHIAVARLADAKARLEVFPNTDAVRAIINGFRRNGQPDKGLSFLSTVSNVPVTMPLWAEVVHTAKESSNPLSALTFYRALQQTELRPDARILSSLLVAMERAEDYSEAKYVLSEVMKHRVRLKQHELNRLLRSLELNGGLDREFCRLFATMEKTGTKIFYERYSPALVAKARAFAVSAAAAEKKKRKESAQSAAATASAAGAVPIAGRGEGGEREGGRKSDDSARSRAKERAEERDRLSAGDRTDGEAERTARRRRLLGGKRTAAGSDRCDGRINRIDADRRSDGDRTDSSGPYSSSSRSRGSDGDRDWGRGRDREKERDRDLRGESSPRRSDTSSSSASSSSSNTRRDGDRDREREREREKDRERERDRDRGGEGGGWGDRPHAQQSRSSREASSDRDRWRASNSRAEGRR